MKANLLVLKSYCTASRWRGREGARKLLAVGGGTQIVESTCMSSSVIL